MKKIINKEIKNEYHHLLNYYQFLNEYHFQKTNKFKHILFENPILIKQTDFNILNFNKKEIIQIPQNLTDFNNTLLYTIQSEYKDHLLFNYYFQYNLLYQFSQIFLKKKFQKNQIQGHILRGNRKKIFISIFGLIFFMKSNELNSNRKFFWKKKIKYKSMKILKLYQLKKLYFKMNINLFQKSSLSRKKYVQEIYSKKKKRYASI